MRAKPIKYQQGVVLVISLMILLVLTIIGIAAVSNATLEERMANNFQQSALVFQGAETSIQNTILAGTRGNTLAPAYTVNNDPLRAALNAGQDVATPQNPAAVTLAGTSSAPVSTTTTVTWLGQRDLWCEGSDPTIICNGFTITTTATVEASNATTTHIQDVGRYQ